MVIMMNNDEKHDNNDDDELIKLINMIIMINTIIHYTIQLTNY